MHYGKLYDEHVADTYDQDQLGLLAGVRALAIEQITATDLPSNATLLDLGVGTGLTLAALGARFPTGRKIGIDLSAKMIAAAQRRLALEAHVDDACNAAAHVPPGSVDLVLAHFLTTFVNRPRLFAAAAQTLRPGGLFSVVSSTSEAFRLVRGGVDQLLGNAGIVDKVSPSPASGDALVAELRASGFEVCARETFRRPVTFDNFDNTLTWGRQSGFFAHVLEALGTDTINRLGAATAGMFPVHDEYVGVAILARPVAR